MRIGTTWVRWHLGTLLPPGEGGAKRRMRVRGRDEVPIESGPSPQPLSRRERGSSGPSCRATLLCAHKVASADHRMPAGITSSNDSDLRHAVLVGDRPRQLVWEFDQRTNAGRSTSLLMRMSRVRIPSSVRLTGVAQLGRAPGLSNPSSSAIFEAQQQESRS